MKKAQLAIVFLLLIAGSFSQAAQADCPLKNLKKNQLRGDNSTAYYPNRDGKSNSNSVNSSSGVSRTN